MDSKKRRVGLLVAAVTTGALLAFAGGGTVGAQLPIEDEDVLDECLNPDRLLLDECDEPIDVPETTVPDPVDESEPVDEPEITTPTTPPAEVLPATQEQDPADLQAPPAAAAATATAAPISLTG
jgi:hypothetical protein